MKNNTIINKNIRTDIITEDETYNINTKKKITNNLEIYTTELKNNIYITIKLNDITSQKNKDNLINTISKEIKKILKFENIKDTDDCLIIGLGNEKCTPDALGPKTANKILITKHLFTLKINAKEGIRPVSAIIPNVMGNTGIETKEIIEGIINKTKPKFIIAIDALASSNINNINKIIQITNSGIHPGSGIGNNRQEISKKTLNIPVIAIGIPTVVESSILVNDTIEYIYKHIAHIKKNYSKYKLSIHTKYNNEILNNKEKEELFGIIGTLNESEKINLINEVLNNINKNLIVTPKEIDFTIEILSEIISKSLNKSLHESI